MVYVGDGKYELPDDFAYNSQYLYVNLEDGKIGMSEIGYAVYSTSKEFQIFDVKKVKKGDPIAKLVTANGDIELRAPIGGKVLKTSSATFKKMKQEPYVEGFLIQVEPSDLEKDSADLIKGESIQAWADELIENLSHGEYIFKIIEVGESSVGKTAIKVRFTDNYFKKDLKSTLGIDFGSKVLNIDYVPEDIILDGIKSLKIRTNVWDFGGQKIYADQRKLYYNKAQGALLIFDVTNPSSFTALPSWIAEMEEYTGKIPVLLVGNKIDLEDERQVTRTEAEEFAQQQGYQYFESSALDGTGVEDAFKALALDIVKASKKE